MTRHKFRGFCVEGRPVVGRPFLSRFVHDGENFCPM